MPRKPRKLTRQQFEARIPGDWKSLQSEGRSWRQNGIYRTEIFAGNKYLHVGTKQVMAPTWSKLAAMAFGD